MRPVSRYAGADRPVDLFRIAFAEGLRERHRRTARTRHDEHAGGLAVEPVNETRFLALLVAEGIQHFVDMARNAGTALHGKPGRLVEDEDFRIFVDQHGAQHFRVLAVAHRVRGQRGAGKLRLAGKQRRHAHRLPDGKPRIGLRPPAVDAHLPGAQQLLQLAETEPRIVQLEPSVEPHARLVALDDARLDTPARAFIGSATPAHGSSLVSHSPAKSAPIASTTLDTT